MINDQKWYENRFGTANTWLIAPGENARSWGDFRKQGIAAIGYGDLGDLNKMPMSAPTWNSLGALSEVKSAGKPLNSFLPHTRFDSNSSMSSKMPIFSGIISQC